MSFRPALRCARPALQAVRSRPASLARAYATGPKSSSSAATLAKLAGSGAAAGFSFALLAGYFSSPTASAQCDGAAIPEKPTTAGRNWEPLHAIEHDDPKNPMRIRMATWVTNLQDHIVKTLEDIELQAPPDGEHEAQKFLRDHWIRPTGGEGSSCVLQGGRVFEKAGVNISIVEGKLPKAAQQQMRADHASIEVSDTPLPYFATGLSIVIHPRSPHVPTVHLNYRYFELADDKTGEPVAWWFGGGSDLTPNYLYEEDAQHFHTTLKAACDKHGPEYFPKYKEWCDEYFYLPHRGETRGVGGIFFDDLTSSSEIHGKPKSRDEVFEFVKSCSGAFLPAYVPIVQKRKTIPWTEEERYWQLLRRGRYVEFNLLYDRGTKFGLNIPGARVESILMSLPEIARWQYMSPIGAEGSGTREEKLLQALKNPKKWAK